jgi:NAD dependent epimerase/dehydratase family enzyme
MSTLVLEGQFMIPKRLQELGFTFKFENAELALKDIFSEQN